MPNYKPGAWVLYAWVIHQSKADSLIKPGTTFLCLPDDKIAIVDTTYYDVDKRLNTI